MRVNVQDKKIKELIKVMLPGAKIALTRLGCVNVKYVYQGIAFTLISNQDGIYSRIKISLPVKSAFWMNGYPKYSGVCYKVFGIDRVFSVIKGIELTVTEKSIINKIIMLPNSDSYQIGVFQNAIDFIGQDIESVIKATTDSIDLLRNCGPVPFGNG